MARTSEIITQKILGLSDQQTALLKQIAKACNQAVQQQNERAKTVITAARAQTPRLLTSSGAIPSAPVELAQLQQGRTSISNTYIQSLQSSLGPDAAAKLDDFIRKKFAPNVSNVPVVQHTPKGKATLPPFDSTGASN